jgi:K+ transporter
VVKGEPKPVVSPEQKYWIEQLRKQGYLVEVCYGWIEAKELIERYLG